MIEWTTVISSGVVAVIIGGMQFISTRYLGRMLDKIEKDILKSKNKEKE